jgi:hypothetical protein
VIDALQPGEKDYIQWCGKLPGFGCRVRKSGSKTFPAMYRIGGRNASTKRVTIGPYGTLTVDQARSQAATGLSKAKRGEDVAAQRTKERAEMTVAQVCDEYMREGVEHKKPSTLESDVSHIACHIKPLLESRFLLALSKGSLNLVADSELRATGG